MKRPTKKRRRRHGIRTTQERRMWTAEFGRMARSLRRLPDYYHEMWAFPERSWKRHRGTQYKPVEMTVSEPPAA